MFIHKTLTYSKEGLIEMEELGKEGWRLCTIYDGRIFLEKEEKKPVKSRALVNESNKGIQYLKMQRKQIDSGLSIHIPDFVNNTTEWIRFINFFVQKNSEEGKMHCEKQKTFDVRLRWENWVKDKGEKQKQTFNSIG